MNRIPLALSVLALLASAGTALGGPRPGVDYKKGQAVVCFAPSVADRIDYYLEGEMSLDKMSGDPSLRLLFERFSVTEMRRFLPSITRIIRGRGDRSPAQAYWDHVRAVDARFPARKARAPHWVHHIPLYGIFVLTFPEANTVAEVCGAFAQNPHVEYAEPNPIFKISMTPNDPQYVSNNMWGISKINCEAAWDTASGSGIVVAVSDTGVRTSHQDLTNRIWTNATEQGGVAGVDDDGNGVIDDIVGYDFYYDDVTPNDDIGHGTHCAGTIGAQENNSLGVVGVAYSCRIMCLKGFGSTAPSGTYPSPLASCLNYTWATGADVSSNSWGSASWSTSYNSILTSMVSSGVIPVFSAGNDNQDGAHHTPSSLLLAVCVAASTPLDGRATFSNFGIPIDVTAPGVSIVSTYNQNNGSYTTMQGTSMACPHVAGALAVLLSHHTGLSVAQYRQILRNAAHDVEHPGWDPHSGYGRLDVNAMLAYDASCVCAADITAPEISTPVSGASLTVTGTAWGPTGFTGYSLDYAPVRAWDSDTWTNIATGSSTVSAGTLATWNISGLSPGRYTLRLSVTNNNSQTFYDRTEFVIDSLSDGDTANAVEVFATPVTAYMKYERHLEPAGDQDWFKIELVSGIEYVFRTSNLFGAVDTEIFLYRSNGTTQVAHNDDYPTGGLKDSLIAWTCDSSGTYYLRVICWSDGGNPAQPGAFELHMYGLFRDAFETDDTSAQAKAHTVAQTANHSIVPAGDIDWISFAAQNGTAYTMVCSSFGANARMALYDTDGSTQIGADATADGNGYLTLTWTCGATGTYFICVDENTGSPAATGHYSIVIHAGEDVLYSEDFDTVGHGLWTPLSGTWIVSAGYYQQTNASDAAHFSTGGLAVWSDAVIEAVVSYGAPTTPATTNAGITLRFEDTDSFYLGRIRANDTAEIARYDNGNMTTIGSAPFNSSPSTDYHLRLVLQGPVLLLYVNGVLRTSAVDRWYDGQGPLALRSFGNISLFDDLRVFRYSATAVTTFDVTTATLADANVTHAYSETIPLTGGTSPYTVSLINSTQPPPGLVLAADGTVSGTPTAVGSYTFDIRVVDSGNRLLGERISIDVTDVDLPQVTINAPTDQSEVAIATPAVSADIADFSSIAEAQVRVGTGGWQDLTHNTGDNYTGTVTLVPGWNTIEVRGEDAHGNENSASVQVFYDDTPPTLAITSPTDGVWTFLSGLTVEGTSGDAVSVDVNGQPATLDAGTGDWTVGVTIVLGANTITATALDSFGRPTAVAITVHFRKLGDIDDDTDVDEDDALLAAQYEAGLVPLSPMQLECGDVDGNGVVDIRDAYAIRQKAAGFPVWKD